MQQLIPVEAFVGSPHVILIIACGRRGLPEGLEEMCTVLPWAKLKCV